MSQLSRRAFLQRSATIASSAALAACTQLPVSFASDVLGHAQILVWSTNDSIDSALARWRRQNPAIVIQRQSFGRDALHERLQNLSNYQGDLPDLVVADTYTITDVPNIDIWRHIERSQQQDAYVRAAIDQTARDSQRLFAYPLTVNPLNMWYHSELIDDAFGSTDNSKLSGMIGTTRQSLAAFLQQLHRVNPQILTFASCFDDVTYPELLRSFVQQEAPYSIASESYTLAKNHIIGRDIHASGAWFDQLKRQRVALSIGGRWMGYAIERSLVRTTASVWRTMPHPLGPIFGPGFVAAIPVYARHFDAAQGFAESLSRTSELQVMISQTTGTLPALIEAYTSDELQGVDPIDQRDTIAQTWRAAQTEQYNAPTPQQIRMMRQLKALFYTWQRNEITDIELNTALSKLPV